MTENAVHADIVQFQMEQETGTTQSVTFTRLTLTRNHLDPVCCYKNHTQFIPDAEGDSMAHTLWLVRSNPKGVAVKGLLYKQ